MAHCPSKKDPDHHDLDGLTTEHFDFGLSAVNVNLDLFYAFDLIRRHFSLFEQVLLVVISDAPEVVLDHVGVLFSFPLQSLLLDFSIIWEVV